MPWNNLCVKQIGVCAKNWAMPSEPDGGFGSWGAVLQQVILRRWAEEEVKIDTDQTDVYRRSQSDPELHWGQSFPVLTSAG